MAPLVGQRVARARTRAPGAVRTRAALDGQVSEVRATRAASTCSLQFDNGRILHSHLRMTGAWHVYREGQRWRRSESARGSCSAPAAVRRPVRRPGARVARPRARSPSTPPCVPRAGSPRRGSADRARRAASAGALAPARAVGELLLDQSVAAGIGNVVRCEALYALRIDPWAPVGGLGDAALAALFEQSRRVLQAGVAAGGALPRAVYGHRVCRRCGARVQRRGQGDEARTVHWCPACQIVCS